MSITPLPTVPQRSDGPAVFADRADTFLAALPTFASEAGTLEINVNAKEASTVAAAAIASGAAAAAGAIAWVSGTTYAIGDALYSPIDLQTYRRKTAGAGTTDPSLDATNWARINLAAIKTLNGVSMEGVGNLITSDIQDFTSSGTWTKPAGCKFVLVELWGGGGGGANSVLAPYFSNGANGGQYAARVIKASDIGATESVTVGAGGSGTPNATSAKGSDGGNTVFGALLTAKGGRGGWWSSAANAWYPGFPADSGQLAVSASDLTMQILASRPGYGIGGAATASATYVPGGNSSEGGGGGGAASTYAGAGGSSLKSGSGGAGNITAATKAGNGAFPSGGGGGSTNNGGGGDGGNGFARVTAWG